MPNIAVESLSGQRPRWYDLRRSLGRLCVRNPLARYAWAFLLVALTTAVASIASVQLEIGTLQLLYVLVVLATAVVGGFGPAIVAATLSFLSVNFFFVTPRYTLRVARPEDVLRLSEFWIAALLSGALAAYARHQTDRAERRVLEISTLHTLNTAIDAESTLQGRLDQIVQTTATLLDLPFCELTLHTPPGSATWGQPDLAGHWLDIPIVADGVAVGQLHAGLPPAQRRFGADEHHVLRLITTQLAHVLERARLLDAAAQARALRESDELKSAILSSLSHDLRTPLTTIQGAVGELKATDVAWTADTRQLLLDSIDEQAQRLRRMVGNLLDLSKLRAGALLPRTDWYALDEVIYHALEGVQTLLGGRVVAVQIPPELPLIRLDFVLTEQVITNILHNAVRYGAADSPIDIIVSRGPAELRCAIRNEGPALPAEWRGRIFEPFVRYAGTATASAGSGLGLAICRGFIEAQGGAITVDPDWTAGVSIVFTLPLDAAPRMDSHE
jgi:two-component system sensor histidine kinase KdpD